MCALRMVKREHCNRNPRLRPPPLTKQLRTGVAFARRPYLGLACHTLLVRWNEGTVAAREASEFVFAAMLSLANSI